MKKLSSSSEHSGASTGLSVASGSALPVTPANKALVDALAVALEEWLSSENRYKANTYLQNTRNPEGIAYRKCLAVLSMYQPNIASQQTQPPAPAHH